MLPRTNLTHQSLAKIATTTSRQSKPPRQRPYKIKSATTIEPDL
jgi:hypothetical protein